MFGYSTELWIIFMLVNVATQNPLTRGKMVNNLGVAPIGWKTDARYSFHWEGDFSYNVPELETCKRVVTPEHGRFVCSGGDTFALTMCLPECEDGYEMTLPEKVTVFICNKDGTWRNLYKKIINTPIMDCELTNERH